MTEDIRTVSKTDKTWSQVNKYVDNIATSDAGSNLHSLGDREAPGTSPTAVHSVTRLKRAGIIEKWVQSTGILGSEEPAVPERSVTNPR